jgi:poly [ADP-ribose] polymerase
MAIVKEQRLILAELGKNHNKWYHLALYADGRIVSKWGRVGDSGQEKMLGYGESLFDAKIAEKKKKGYVETRTLPAIGVLHNNALHPKELEQVATEQIAANSPEAVALIKKLVKANVHQIMESTTLTYNSQTGLFSTPLGIVTQDALDEARQVLTQIGGLVQRGAWQDYQFQAAANSFLNLVPQNIGRTPRSCRDLFPDLKAVRERNDVLDRLETSLQMAVTNPATAGGATTSKVFEASLQLVGSRSEFHALNAKFKSMLNRSHACSNLKLRRAYTVEIASMKKAYEAKSASINNVMELWHGTNTGNILSILKDGFKVQPPATAAITGKLLGNGIYFGIQSSKSLNYSFGYWSGTRHKTCYLFLCEVAVGRYQVPKGATSKRPDRGYHSYWARPGQTSGIVNDEIVIFDEAQINPRYLLEFRED